MFTAAQFRAHIAAQFVCTHNFKRTFTAADMAEVMARADQLIAAASCISCDGTGKFDTGMDPATRSQRPEDLVPCDHGVELQKSKVATLAKESGPVGISNQGAAAAANDPWGDASATPTVAANTNVLETPTAKAASADLMSGLETALVVKCKACSDTGKNSKGKPCICQQHPPEAGLPVVEKVKPLLAPEAAATQAVQPLTARFETDQYLCEGCSNSNLIVTLVPGKTPQTASYACKDCGQVGEVPFDTPPELAEFISLAKKISQEVPLVAEAPKKTRKKKSDEPNQPGTLPSPSDIPSPAIPPLAAPAIPQFNFPKPPPIPTAAAPVIAAAQQAEQNVTGSTEVDIVEPEGVDVTAASSALAGLFDGVEDAKIIKEWEVLTSRVFDAKIQSIDMLKKDLTDQLLGIYTGK